MSRLEEIQGNWKSGRAVNPEDIDYLLGRIEEMEKDIQELIEVGGFFQSSFYRSKNKNNRYKQALEKVVTKIDNASKDDYTQLIYEIEGVIKKALEETE